MPLDLPAIRARFPALQWQTRGRPIAFFDGPAGSQVPVSMVNAVSDSLLRANANCGAVFTTSQENDQLLAESRQAVADLLGTDDPDTVAFGANMTSLTLAASCAIEGLRVLLRTRTVSLRSEAAKNGSTVAAVTHAKCESITENQRSQVSGRV